MDESRSTQRTETEDTEKSVNKSISISSASLSDKSTKIVKPKEIDIRKYNSSLSGMSRHGESVPSVTPDKQRIPRKNRRKKTSDTPIKEKGSIQEQDSPNKRAKEDGITDVENIQIRTPAPFKNKEDYIGDTNEKTRGSDDSPSETDGYARNLVKEHENEEDEEVSEKNPEINESIK